ncbi:MAG: hypothetical protein K0B10_07155 [Vicingaceae bacterium]|nr:hypothetical protein [Vicingaceae bacterium]
MPAPLLLAATNPKLIKQLVIVVIVIIVLYAIYRWYKKYSAKQEALSLVKSSENEIITNTKTFTDSDYKLMADKLFTAMKGLGTDNDAVLQVISSLKTKSDWLSLVSAFGVRESGFWPNVFTGNLINWLSDELGGSARNQVNYSLSRFSVQI